MGKGTNFSGQPVLSQLIKLMDRCVEYNRVGVIRPVKDKIWENRFMAVEEGAENATLGFTTFEKVSGGDFYPGLLLRELK